MDLITIIVIIAFISKIIKKGQAEQERMKKNTTPQNVWDQVAGQVKNGQTQSRKYSSSQSEKWKKLARENIENARKRAEEKFREAEAEVSRENYSKNTYQMPKKNVRTTPAYEQITLQQVHTGRMEAEHNHFERVSPAEHHHPEEVIPENMLGTIEDLMIKGYEGNLCFERDFVGEAMDMISRFTVPSDIPDFSKDDVA